MDEKNLDELRSVEELVSHQGSVRSALKELNDEYAGLPFPDEARAKFAALQDTDKEIESRVAELQARDSYVDRISQKDSNKESTTDWDHIRSVSINKRPDDIYNTVAIRNMARTPDDEVRMLRDNAKRAIELARFPGTLDRQGAQTYTEWVLDNVVEAVPGTLARRILHTGTPLYDKAFGKALKGAALDNDEARALSLTAGAGGNAVTFDLDPTIMGTSTRQVNPIRALARVIPVTTDEWRGVTSGAITTGFAAEATEATDNAPTLTQPAISTEKAFAWVPFSIEIDQDWPGMRGEMSMLLQESKDDLEAVKFTTGTGTNEPFGVIVGATTTVNATTGQTTDAEDFYRLTAALPERYQPRASIMANRAIYNLVRQFVLTGQSNPWKDLEEPTITEGRAGTLLGYPAYMNSAMAAVTTTGSLFAIVGDFSRFVIIDRVGLTVELLPLVVGANQRPTGQRGLYAYWRVGSKVINADAFRVLIGIA